MASDSDSDSGSYVSATPPRPSRPRSPTPPPCDSSARFSSLLKLKSKLKPEPIKKSTRNIQHSAQSKRSKEHRCSKVKDSVDLNPKPESESEAQSKPEPDPGQDGRFLSDPDNLPIRICKPETSSSSSNVNSSIARLVKLRQPSFNPDSEFKVDTPDLAQVKQSAQNQSNSKQAKRVHPNLIRVDAPISKPFDELKRPKLRDEGNFVRLNINGYGRKPSFSRNGKRKYSANGGFRRKKWSGKKSKNEDNELDLAGLDGIVEKQKGHSEWGKEIEEAVVAVREDLSEENLRNLLKLSHGYDLFREGQVEAIKNVLMGESTMLVLPTGAGKSLCYQLPALISTGVTLVVSPLLALMVDQLKKLPPILPGGLLSSNQTSDESLETLNRLRSGEIKVLFVSPERLLNSKFLSAFDDLTISLFVIDEAHCISEWSHNFRPSYLRLRASLLREKLNVKCILAMTATATTDTLDSIMRSLEISPKNLIKTSQIRANFQLSVSSSENRLKDLLMLLKTSPFVEMKSIIVYCKFQAETDMISKLLCDNHMKAKSYHSGLPAKERSLVQQLFCASKIRVVVATVAFGMGLDKSDVEGVIHYSLPDSLEEYIQETGRAGRDGRLSHCHLFVDTTTYYKMRSLSYSDGVEEYAISKLLGQIFSNEVSGHIHSLLKEATSRKLDIKEEVIFTVLTMLEIGDEQHLHLLPQLNVTCSLSFHKTSPHFLADKDMLIRSILNLSEKKGGLYVFDIPTVANVLHIQVGEVLDQLKNLKISDEVTYDLKDQAYCFELLKRPDDLFALSACLTKWLSQVEMCKVQKLDTMYKVANFALKECKGESGCSGSLHTSCIQEHISAYFSNKPMRMGDDCTNAMKQHSPFLHADLKSFLKNNSTVKLTPRALARIMHGIPSPAFPSSSWARNYFWSVPDVFGVPCTIFTYYTAKYYPSLTDCRGRYVEVDFQVVMEAAKIELMNFIRKNTEET